MHEPLVSITDATEQDRAWSIAWEVSYSFLGDSHAWTHVSDAKFEKLIFELRKLLTTRTDNKRCR